MRLSKLQKYILDVCYNKRNSKLEKKELLQFYSSSIRKPKREDQIGIISKSIERLISKGLLVGYGEITQRKTFINKIKLTSLGKKQIKKILGQQKKLPLNN